jgi:hypothetical protein
MAASMIGEVVLAIVSLSALAFAGACLFILGLLCGALCPPAVLRSFMECGTAAAARDEPAPDARAPKGTMPDTVWVAQSCGRFHLTEGCYGNATSLVI